MFVSKNVKIAKLPTVSQLCSLHKKYSFDSHQKNWNGNKQTCIFVNYILRLSMVLRCTKFQGSEIKPDAGCWLWRDLQQVGSDRVHSHATGTILNTSPPQRSAAHKRMRKKPRSSKHFQSFRYIEILSLFGTVLVQTDETGCLVAQSTLIIHRT